MNRCWLAMLLICLRVAAWGQQTAPSSAGSFPHFTLAKGQLDADGFPTSGAKLCVLGRDICYQMPPHTLPGPGKVTYDFGLAPRSERLPLAGGGSWIFFSATFSAGGSGTLERLAVLRYEGDRGSGRIVNLMPYAGATNVSDRAMWTVPGASKYPILVKADFIWGEGEGHFSQHFYTVEAWCFDPRVVRYAKAFSYRTAKKYDGGDNAPVRVLAPERQEILRRLGFNRWNDGPPPVVAAVRTVVSTERSAFPGPPRRARTACPP